jgi:hypothetical protein
VEVATTLQVREHEADVVEHGDTPFNGSMRA